MFQWKPAQLSTAQISTKTYLYNRYFFQSKGNSYVLVSQTVAKSFGKNPKTRFFHFVGPSRLGRRLPNKPRHLEAHTSVGHATGRIYDSWFVKKRWEKRCFR